MCQLTRLGRFRNKAFVKCAAGQSDFCYNFTCMYYQTNDWSLSSTTHRERERERMSRMAKVGLVFVPSCAAGHLTAMLELAKRFLVSGDNHLSITVLLMKPPWYKLSSPSLSYIESLSSSGLDISFPPPRADPPEHSDGPEDLISLYFQLHMPRQGRHRLLSDPRVSHPHRLLRHRSHRRRPRPLPAGLHILRFQRPLARPHSLSPHTGRQVATRRRVRGSRGGRGGPWSG
ncbi:UDP-glycosyltransferase 71A15-like [Iris pallida]|uniref:UDP-glycosyltransferase 71A15-like n=1 Tax=Iris pallida TaxID=29817 RepID=A0AAX6HF78_IRIPA|nr:UDP-glycosyltransferase 71A15-like [Iris pallida]KAJ6839287.1 UDP-glycosyltransferase 71A15-like [Iris pallida]